MDGDILEPYTEKQIQELQLISKHSIFRLDAHYSQTYLCAITK